MSKIISTLAHRILCFGAVLSLGATAQAQINGLVTTARVGNGSPTSTLVITNSNTIPGSATIDDRLATGTFGTNRHDVLLSGDGGASPYVFSIDTPFTISTDLVLTGNANSPRKEAGIRINAPATGDALFLVNSDAGEIVTFGGGAPFHLFGNNGGGTGYAMGTKITLGMTYTPGSPNTTTATPAKVEFFANYPSLGGFVTTGPLQWSNLEGGPTNFTVGVYTQWTPADGNDFVHAEFTNIAAGIPEPASLGLLSLAGAGLIRRRTR